MFNNENSEIANSLVLRAKEKGLILFWLLIEKKAVRITPPLTISKKEISLGCEIIISILNSIESECLISLLRSLDKLNTLSSFHIYFYK